MMCNVKQTFDHDLESDLCSCQKKEGIVIEVECGVADAITTNYLLEDGVVGDDDDGDDGISYQFIGKVKDCCVHNALVAQKLGRVSRHADRHTHFE
jgi:hypothetical protein